MLSLHSWGPNVFLLALQLRTPLPNSTLSWGNFLLLESVCRTERTQCVSRFPCDTEIQISKRSLSRG